jgi:hypothetical protein
MQAARDNEARKKEQEQEQNKLEAKLQLMFYDLQLNKTPFEYTLSGTKLNNVQCRMLTQNVAFNSTLLSLHLSRKGINDTEGVWIAKMLGKNSTLRKLELEGNNLGQLSAYEFGRTLKDNKTLKFLDLESNQLTSDGTNLGGISEFIKFLLHNKSLISLNLCNNQLEPPSGEQIKNNLESNWTLMDFDYSMNNFSIDDSRAIQELLKRNKRKYDSDRLREWKERKRMKAEDAELQDL